MNPRQKLTILTMDVLLFLELAAGMYLGWQNGDDFAGAFVRFYVPAALLTVVSCLYLARRFRAPEPIDAPAPVDTLGETR